MTTIIERLKEMRDDPGNSDMPYFWDQYHDLITCLEKAVEALDDIESGYDCDPDAHKYGTRCRKCCAKEALTEISSMLNVEDGNP